MSSELGGITNNSIRDAIGTRSFAAAGLAIHGANSENVLTAAAVPHTINGVFQTALAIDAELDLSATTVLSAKDGSTLADVVTMEALAAGDDPVTKVYVLACKGNASFIIEPEVDVAAAQDDADYTLSCPDGYCPYGLIKIVQAPTPSVGVALFKLGTTDMTGVTGQTVTFFDVATLPPTVADIVEN